MAKKSKKVEQLKQELISSVPAEQRKMITQPITFSYLNGEMTMMQTRIQTKIMEKLQERIAKALKRNKEQGFVGDLFTSADYNKLPDDDTIYLTFEIRYSEMGVEPAHYDDIDRAVKAMQGIVYEKEATDEKGASYTDRTVVFNRVRIPNKDKSVGDIERRDSVKLLMLPGVARDLFNLIPYQQYLRDAVSLFSSGYTGRIYLLINANKGLGTWVCPYEKLRRILLTTWDERKKDWVVDKYKEIGDFKKRVLEPAKKEILEVKDRVDCTFDYEFQYPAGKKRGTPEAIIFHIHITDLGRNIKQRQLEAKDAIEQRKGRGLPHPVKLEAPTSAPPEQDMGEVW